MGKSEIEWFNTDGERHIRRSETGQSGLRWVAWLSNRAMVMSGTWLLTGSISEYMDLLLSWSVLMSIASDNTYGQEERAVED